MTLTEIQWLVDMLLHEKMPGKAKDRFIARIGEAEMMLVKPPPSMPRPMLNPPNIQAPSTQRLLDDHPIPQAPLAQPPGKIDRETGSVMVPTGNGTFGKRKF